MIHVFTIERIFCTKPAVQFLGWTMQKKSKFMPEFTFRKKNTHEIKEYANSDSSFRCKVNSYLNTNLNCFCKMKCLFKWCDSIAKNILARINWNEWFGNVIYEKRGIQWMIALNNYNTQWKLVIGELIAFEVCRQLNEEMD